VRIFAAHTGGTSPWVESALLADVRELLDVDVAPLAQGRSVGLDPHPAQVFLVCTHGRHDACCAERGRPVAAAMASAAPDHVWEVSHIGGDRFAPNVLVLPHGLYYGGLDPADSRRFLETQLAGRLDLEHLRGRTAYAFPIQAAEIALRRRLGLLDVTALRVVEHERSGAETRVVFEAAGEPWEARVRTSPGPHRRLTCSASRTTPAPVHEVLDLHRVSPSPAPA
jgi:(2Fe-2S) ferredoxin